MPDIREELEASGKNLSAKRQGPQEGAGHNFGKSKISKLARGESAKAPPEIYDENMKSETNNG